MVTRKVAGCTSVMIAVDTNKANNDADGTTNSVEVIDETGYAEAADLGEVLEHFMAELGLVARELTLVFCDDARIRELNAAHRDVDAATDVLSYPTSEPDDDWHVTVPHLGDIIISVDTARTQAEVAGHSLEQEILILAAHGLTHLLGFDHPTEDAWNVFNDHQKRILAHWHPPV